MKMTDFRALCAELVDAWDDLPWEYDFKGNITGIHGDLCDDSAVDRARAALAQPEPEAEPPTQRQLLQLAAEFWPEGCEPTQAVPYARAVLSRFGGRR